VSFFRTHPSSLLLAFTSLSARNALHESSPRVMAVLDPVLLVISGLSEATDKAVSVDHSILWDVPDFPFAPARGSHTVPMSDRIFIDRSDVRLVDSEVIALSLTPIADLLPHLSGFLWICSWQSCWSQVCLPSPGDFNRSLRER
jgi:hypothetical protein